MKKKKKILLLSDDIRLPSGVGTVSSELVKGTVDRYDWVQIAGAVHHPEMGKRIDFSEEIRKATNIPHAYCVLYPVTGYGDPNILRQVVAQEKPDLIMHFTDPRFWGWLYDMENEIRQQIPLTFLTIWDDLPYPRWNENCYESCDMLMTINRQTYNIVKQVRQREPVKDWQLQYVPHGINEKIYRPVNVLDKKYNDAWSSLFGEDNFKKVQDGFLFFFNARNIQRKRTSDILAAFDALARKYEDAYFLLHCPKVDQAGTNLGALIEDLFPKEVQERIYFYERHDLSQQQLNIMYNMADATVLLSSAEGYGLSCAESLMAGTPVVVNCTGGLQDQIGLKKPSGEYLTVDDYNNETPTYSYFPDTPHGEWAFVTWPQPGLQGSPSTYAIYDSRASIPDMFRKMEEAYLDKENLPFRGYKGRQYLINDAGMNLQGMLDSFVDAMEGCFENFTPRQKVGIYQPQPRKFYKHTGAMKIV